jgi:hypothetical protein
MQAANIIAAISTYINCRWKYQLPTNWERETAVSTESEETLNRQHKSRGQVNSTETFTS